VLEVMRKRPPYASKFAIQIGTWLQAHAPASMCSYVCVCVCVRGTCERVRIVVCLCVCLYACVCTPSWCLYARLLFVGCRGKCAQPLPRPTNSIHWHYKNCSHELCVQLTRTHRMQCFFGLFLLVTNENSFVLCPHQALSRTHPPQSTTA